MAARSGDDDMDTRYFSVRGTRYNRTMSEWKHIDTSINADMTTVPVFTLLNGLRLGITSTTRVGTRVVVFNVSVHLGAMVIQAAGVEQFCRFIVFYDKQTRGVAPSVLDILAASSPLALYNPTNINRFHILMDKSFPLGSSVTSTGTYTSRVWHGLLTSVTATPVDYNSGDTGTVGDISSGSIYLLCLGSQPLGTASKLSGDIRVWYTDL